MTILTPRLSLGALTSHIQHTSHSDARRTPHSQDEHLFLSDAQTIAARIRAGELDAIEVVEAHIRFARQLNPLLNAIVADRYHAARKEARAIDARRASEGADALPSLAGVPCTIKESFALAGMPNSAGLVARKHVRSTQDAVTVRRWRDAGAIPLGVTNTPELCMWYETHNHVYGRTNNAYSEAHICGGSSGGEGAIVGSGASPFGLGSDVGGSIRMPAFFNGIFGHKPTGGLVPSSGQYPRSDGDALRYLCTGPLCRRATDLYPLTCLLAGDDGLDVGIRPDLVLEDPSRVDLSSLHVHTILSNDFIHPSAEIQDALVQAANTLEGLGAYRTDASFPLLSKSFDIWSAMLSSSEGPSFRELLHQEDASRSLLTDFYQWTARRSPHTLPAIILAMTERLTSLLEQRVGDALADGERLKHEISDLLGDRGVLLYPTFPTAAPRHFQPLVRPAHFVYTAIFNVLEFPATHIPLGLNEDGLPLGIQVIANHGNDHLTLACAEALERELGGWVPPWQRSV